MTPEHDSAMMQTRRQFLGRTSAGIGSVALASLLNPRLFAGLAGFPNFAPKAKRVIYLFQSGAPSQFELLDHKPALAKAHGQVLGSEFFGGQRLTGMTSGQKEKKICKSIYNFSRCGQSGTELSELLPHLGQVADELCVVRSMQTQAINHDPAITFFQTGFQQAGRPSMGAWASYGLGSESADLPAYVVMISQGSAKRDSQALYARLWGSGFLPSENQGLRFRSGANPVLHLQNPSGIGRDSRRLMLDRLRELHELQLEGNPDAEIESRIAQYEMAFRMQASIPEVTDISGEPEHVLREYGDDVKNPGTFAANCLQARRLAERGVRFIQLYHPGWDQHGGLPGGLRTQARETDQPSAALVRDLKQRGMLDDTLVIWGGEFGRTNYCQGTLGKDNFGRDHHGRCFSLWMAGGGAKGGTVVGQTDDYGYNVVKDGVHVHDFHATLLHLLGIDHERLTFKYQGRYFRLTDVHGNVVRGALA